MPFSFIFHIDTSHSCVITLFLHFTPSISSSHALLRHSRGTAKRFFVTGTGKIMRWRAGKRNVLRTKSARQLRGLDKRVEIPKVLYKKYRRSLPYAF